MELNEDELYEIYNELTEKIVNEVVENKMVTDLINSEFNKIGKQLIINKILQKSNTRIISIENINKLLNEINKLKSERLK